MNKSDLQNGMIVECENGKKFMVVRNFNEHTVLFSDETRDVFFWVDGGYMPFSDYNEDLKLTDEDEYGYSIVKVGYPEQLGCPIDTHIKWIWERTTLTEDEKAILRSVDKCFRYIARSGGALVIYEDKPRKVIYEDEENNGDYWITWMPQLGRVESLRPFNHLFSFIKNEDTEPYNIDDLLKRNGVKR